KLTYTFGTGAPLGSRTSTAGAVGALAPGAAVWTARDADDTTNDSAPSGITGSLEHPATMIATHTAAFMRSRSDFIRNPLEQNEPRLNSGYRGDAKSSGQVAPGRRAFPLLRVGYLVKKSRRAASEVFVLKRSTPR